jgi:ABC-type sugar transport system, permease component
MKEKFSLIGLSILAIIICIPVYLLFVGSFMGIDEVIRYISPIWGSDGNVRFGIIPMHPTLRQYVELLFDSPEFFVMFWNSVKIVVCVILGQLIIATTCAWGLSCYEFVGAKIIFWVYTILMMIPFQVRMLSDYLVLDMFKLLNTHGSIIYSGIFSTFPVFILYGFFKELPVSLLEAARLDGASEMQIFLKIGVPLGMSGIMSVIVLSFLEYWNLIEQPLVFLKNKTLWPLSLYLPEIGLSQLGIAFSGAVITLLPAIFVFLLGQDYLERGIMSSAIKE